MQVDVSADVIEAQIVRFAEEITNLESQRTVIEEKIVRTKRERELWQSILALRVSNHGLPQQAFPITNQVPLPDEYGGKGRTMRQHILESFETGVTPKSVQEHMQRIGLPVSANFVYKTLNKLRDEGKITSIGGVWRPVRNESAAA